MSKTPLFDVIVDRLGNELNVWLLDQLVNEVIDGVRQYDEEALGEDLATSVAILYGTLVKYGVAFEPLEIITLAREQIGASN